jgi:hypothetical protein
MLTSVSYQIESYSIQYTRQSPRIYLKGRKVGSVTSKDIAQIWFLDDRRVQDQIAEDESVFLTYSLSEFPFILDLLRNESPLTLYCTTESQFLPQNGIYAGSEPVGANDENPQRFLQRFLQPQI